EHQITPMVALRGALCSDRWDEAWATITAARRRRHPAQSSPPARLPASAASVVAPVRRAALPAIPDLGRDGPKTIVNGRPTPRHPWKRFPAASPPTQAKL